MGYSKNSMTLQAAFRTRLEQDPQGRAIAFYDDRGKFQWRTFEEFYTNAVSKASHLYNKGLRKGDVCIIVLPSNELSATMIISTLLLGGLPLLIAPPSLQADGAYSNLQNIIAHVVKKTNPRLVVVDESLAYLNQNVDGRREAPEYIIAEMNIEWQDSVEMHFAYPDETELAALQLTSGTTGMPRVCSWRQASVIEALDGMVSAMTLAADDIFLNWTPLYHDMGLVNNFFLCMVKRYPVVMLNPNDFVKKPSLWMRGLQDTQATQTWSPNFGFALSVQRVRDSELHGIDLSHVRGFWSAAERVHYETMVQFYERFRSFGVKREALKTNFGCAENIGGATFSDPQRSFSVEFIDREAFLNQRIAKPIGEGQENTLTVVGVGKPHRKMRIDILARNGRVLPEGHVGEVALITPSRMRGYLKDAKATQRAIKGDYLRTGDMGYLRNGELFWTGRVRERITIRGVKFDPSDLEPILFDVPGLRQGCFAAFGIDDEGIGTQRLVIITEVRNGVSAPVEQIIDDIRGRVFQTLGLSVSEVMLVRQGTLTKTSSGKRRHRFFRQEYLTGNLQDYIWAPEVIA